MLCTTFQEHMPAQHSSTQHIDAAMSVNSSTPNTSMTDKDTATGFVQIPYASFRERINEINTQTHLEVLNLSGRSILYDEHRCIRAIIVKPVISDCANYGAPKYFIPATSKGFSVTWLQLWASRLNDYIAAYQYTLFKSIKKLQRQCKKSVPRHAITAQSRSIYPSSKNDNTNKAHYPVWTSMRLTTT